jgi:hypothetical protein
MNVEIWIKFTNPRMRFLKDGGNETGNRKLRYIVDTGILLNKDVRPLEP